MKTVPKITELYRLPFSKNDNPNGWIEITTRCNMRCPGCYRGCNRPDHEGEDISLDKLKADIDELVRIRNCHIISISGGEPLLHPQLDAIISFIHEKGLKPWLHTNGKLLTRSRLYELRKAGLDGIIIRVDSLAAPRAGITESSLNKKRQELAELVASVKGIHLSYISVVNKDNLNEIPAAISWARANHHLIDFMALIPMREVKFRKEDKIDASKWIYLEDLCNTIEGEFPGIRYASFLGSQHENDSIRWLQSVWLILNGKLLGYIQPKMVELFQAWHHFRYRKYAYRFGQGRSVVNLFQLLMLGLFLKEARTLRNNYLKQVFINPVNIFRKASIQLMCYIIPPGGNDRVLDICDGCPDAILYKGKLYPSCGLEEIKLEYEQS